MPEAPEYIKRVSAEIEQYLLAIERLLPNTYKLTLLARYTGTQYNDADILLTVDGLAEVRDAIERLRVKPTYVVEPKKPARR